ncbi:MAG TPA: VTT domain-containing protein [Solirubrobacterales bacterium]
MPSKRLIGGAAVGLAAIAAAACLLPHSPAQLRDLILGVGLAGPALALASWVLLTPALFPGPVLGATCGLAFGFLGGAALAWAGAVLGGLTAFALARTIARSHVQHLLERRRRLGSIDAALEHRGFSAMLAARLMPGVPVSWLHYVAGVSRVRPRAFFGAIAIGALLRTTPYALLGQGLAGGSMLTLGAAGASIAIGGLAAGFLLRRLRAAPTPA